jgi:hypothetical protein
MRQFHVPDVATQLEQDVTAPAPGVWLPDGGLYETPPVTTQQNVRHVVPAVLP